MLSAEEAREMPSEYVDHRQEEWLKRIEFSIKEAIRMGYGVIYIEESIPKEVVDVLESLGYTVEMNSRYNEVYTEISW